MLVARGSTSLLLALLIVVSGSLAGAAEASKAPSVSAGHDLWDGLLKRYVDSEGHVAYGLLRRKGRNDLSRYLQTLAEADPSAMTQADALAFWINAYNAGIVAAIEQGYSPETSLSRLQLFRWYTFRVAGKARTPDEIEHEILRQQFKDPRIHFALVCGARSCPRLRREAYRGDRVDAQLDDQARQFVNDRRKNVIDPASGRIELSSIFSWFEADFADAAGTVGHFVARYTATPEQAAFLRRQDVRIRYKEYDWALNTQDAQKRSDEGLRDSKPQSNAACDGKAAAAAHSRAGRTCPIS